MPEYKMPDLEEVICEAIVRRFFEPSVTGIEFVPGPWVDGRQTMAPTPKYGTAPLADVATQMYLRNKDDLAERIWSRIDVDDLADRMAVKITEGLLVETGSRWGNFTAEAPQVTALKEAVNKRLADELTRRALAKLDAADGEA